jgi:hypothetical protein
VALIQADNALHMEKNTNQGDANDPYFSPKTLTNSTAPNTRFWSGSASGYGVTAISSSAATMTATLIGSPIAPAVATSSVSEIRATSATLNGTVNDNNAATQVSFEYGPTSGYGRTASGVSISAGFGTTAESVTISGLVCNSIYHYRITGSNTISTSISADSSFTTSACPPDAPAITSVAVGNSLANIYFVPPGSDNGSPISSYTATSNSGQYVNGETVPLTVSGLVNGSSYTFTVRARNAAGEGPASPVSEGVTPGVVVIDDVDAFGYQQLQHAYDADTSGKKIKLLADTSVGALTVDSLNSKGIVTITGGYNNAFSDHDGQSSILGKVTLSAGTTRFQNVKVRLP